MMLHRSEAPAPLPRVRIVQCVDGLVIVDKPPGLPSTGRTPDDPDCAQDQVRVALGSRRPVWAVHQLDKDTSGLNLFVTRRSLVADWAERLKAAPEAKRYLALVYGEVAAELRVDVPLGRARRADGREFPAVVRGPAGKPALTRVLPRTTGAGFSWVEARTYTGRTHQVRLHLAHAGHPLVGEPFHRDPPCPLHPRHALHAWALELGGDLGRVEAPLPPDLVALSARLGVPLPGPPPAPL